jgi:DedD protein
VPSAPEATPPPAVPAEPARIGGSAWAVQLGSFSSAANAASLRDRLRTRGYPAFVETVQVGQGRSSRVYVGPERDRSRAEQYLQRLQKEGKDLGLGSTPLVVRYAGAQSGGASPAGSAP